MYVTHTVYLYMYIIYNIYIPQFSANVWRSLLHHLWSSPNLRQPMVLVSKPLSHKAISEAASDILYLPHRILFNRFRPCDFGTTVTTILELLQTLATSSHHHIFSWRSTSPGAPTQHRAAKTSALCRASNAPADVFRHHFGLPKWRPHPIPWKVSPNQRRSSCRAGFRPASVRVFPVASRPSATSSSTCCLIQ